MGKIYVDAQWCCWRIFRGGLTLNEEETNVLAIVKYFFRSQSVHKVSAGIFGWCTNQIVYTAPGGWEWFLEHDWVSN